MLEYDVFSYVDEAGWGAIDGDIVGAGVLRGVPTTDTEGNGIHTGVDLSASCYDQWWHRVVILGVTEEDADLYTVGRKFSNVQIAMHPGSGEDGIEGVVLYDNIVITNNGEVKLVIFRDESDFDPDSVRFSHCQGTDKGKLECLVFTDAEMQAFKDAEEAKIREEESREASKAEAEASREASREQASIDASIAASISEEEAANATEAPTESKNEGGLNLGLIIGIAAGVVVIIVVIVVIAVTGKKKGGKESESGKEE